MAQARETFCKILIYILVGTLFGCTHGPVFNDSLPEQPQPPETSYTHPPVSIPDELLEPIISYPPRETADVALLKKRVSLSLNNVGFRELVDMLSRATGIDIVYDEKVNVSKRFNLEIRDKSLKEVLDTICNMLGYYYEVKNGTVYFKVFQTRYYDIGIPKIVITPNITVTGNILSGAVAGTGATGTTSSGGVSGGVNYSFSGLENDNPYDKLEEMVNGVLSSGGKVLIDEDTGFMVVTAKKNDLEEVDKIVQRFKYFYSKQVEVEVSIIEITYNRGKDYSIDWNAIIPKLSRNLSLSFSPVGGGATTDIQGMVLRSGTLTAGEALEVQSLVVNFLKQYGTTKIVSSPKLRLTNGYSALMVAGEVRPYFTRTEEVGSIVATNSTGVVSAQKLVNYEVNTYLKGALLNVKVRIDERNQIFLQVTPMIQDILRDVSSPDNAITAPVTMMRQATTILKLHNNDIAILAGLRGRKVSMTKSGVPYLMDIKGLGAIARNESSSVDNTEIVMVIRAKLVY